MTDVINQVFDAIKMIINGIKEVFAMIFGGNNE